MLIAASTDGTEVLSIEGIRGQDYYCPACKSKVVLRSGAIRYPHFSHLPNSHCHWAKGESPRHREMKIQLGALFKKQPVEYERFIFPDLRADLLVARKFVVECQASALGLEDWENRTLRYNSKGFHVLWVWDTQRVFGKYGRDSSPIPPLGSGDRVCLDREIRPCAEVRYCHQFSFGRIYVLDHHGNIYSCHLDAVEPRESEWFEEGGVPCSALHYPKTLKKAQFHKIGNHLTPFVGPKGHRLVQLGEGCWWKK